MELNKSKTQENTRKYDYIVVLGHRLEHNGQMSKILDGRLDLAYKLYAEGVSDKIILSGGISSLNVQNPESEPMRNYLVKLGVPKENLIEEDHSFDTVSNAYYTRYALELINCFRTEGIKRNVQKLSIALVTSEFHSERAAYIFKQVFGNGTKIEVYESETKASNLQELLRHERHAIAEVKSTFNSFNQEKGREENLLKLLSYIKGKMNLPEFIWPIL